MFDIVKLIKNILYASLGVEPKDIGFLNYPEIGIYYSSKQKVVGVAKVVGGAPKRIFNNREYVVFFTS